jgi:hypothetical protein
MVLSYSHEPAPYSQTNAGVRLQQKAMPLGESSDAIGFVVVARCERSLQVEVVVDLGMDGRKLF